MKNTLKTIIIALISLMAAAPGATAADDGIYTEANLKSLVVSNPDSVLKLLDEADRMNPSPMAPFKMDIMRGLAYNEKRMFRMAEKAALAALASDSIADLPSLRIQALMMVAKARAFYGNYEGSINAATEAIGIARQTGNRPGEYNLLVTVADIAFSMGDSGKGYAYLEQVITSGENSDNVRELANVSSAIGSKVIALYTDGRYEEALEEGQRRMKVIDRIDRLGGAPDGFTDQQRAYAYARIASSLRKLGRIKEARQAYEAFTATRYGQTVGGRAYITDYLIEAGEWAKVKESMSPLYEILHQGDTINDDYRSVLYSTALAESGLGHHKAGNDLLQRVMVIQDSLHAREKESSAREAAAMFDLNEKELLLQKAQADGQRRQILLWATAGIALLVIVILAVTWTSYRNTLRRNKIAIRQIKELTAEREYAYRAAIRTGSNDQGKDMDTHPRDHSVEDGSDSSHTTADDYADFIRMESMLMENHLFITGMNRETIAAHTGLSRSQVTLLIQKYAECTPAEYANKLRINYSIQLMRVHPEWTIDAIASESGYTSRNTYYINFNKFYGMTPAQFRKQLGKEA